MLRLLPLVVLLAGCSLLRTPLIDPPDTGGIDAGVDAPIEPRDVPEGFDGGGDGGMRDTGGMDSGMPDTGGMDTGMPDTGVDAGMRDTGVDAGMPDTGVDAGMPDTGVDAGMRDTGVDAPVRRTCAEVYGTASGYFECTAAVDSECEFYTTLGGSTCNARCASFGGTCLAVYNNGSSGGPGRCTRNGTRDCAVGASDRICVCSLP